LFFASSEKKGRGIGFSFKKEPNQNDNPKVCLGRGKKGEETKSVPGLMDEEAST